VHEANSVADHRGDAWGQLVQVTLSDVFGANRRTVVDLGQDQVLFLQDDVKLLAEDLRIQQVLDAQSDPRGLVGVGRSDPAFGGAERVLAEKALGQPVEFLVVGHDQVRVARDDESRHVDIAINESVEFRQEDGRVHHHAVADDGRHSGIENARGYELKCELLPFDDDAVTGVMAALVAHHKIHVASQKVG
jgi:hypothetical protein